MVEREPWGWSVERTVQRKKAGAESYALGLYKKQLAENESIVSQLRQHVERKTAELDQARQKVLAEKIYRAEVHDADKNENFGEVQYDGTMSGLSNAVKLMATEYKKNLVAFDKKTRLMTAYNWPAENERLKKLEYEQSHCPKCGEEYGWDWSDFGAKKYYYKNNHVCYCKACHAPAVVGSIVDMADHICGKSKDDLWLELQDRISNNLTKEIGTVNLKPPARIEANDIFGYITAAFCGLTAIFALVVLIISGAFEMIIPLAGSTVAAIGVARQTRKDIQRKAIE